MGQETPVIRFFCSADSSALGLLALAYTDAMVALGFTVRIVARHFAAFERIREGSAAVGWQRHQNLLITPIDGKNYTNVVCGDESDHKRLWTAGVKNVLVTAFRPPPDAEDCRASVKYHTIVVPTRDLATSWESVGGRAVVIPMMWAEYALALRDVLS